MSTINGTAGNDTLTGTPGPDTLNGLGGNDELIGLDGHDLLQGGPGNDVLVGGRGNDTLDGGAGDDRVLYYRETGTRGVSVNLGTGIATDTFGDTDRLIGITQVYGSNWNDTLLGAPDRGTLLFGGDGNDLLRATGAADVLVGGRGADTLDGGSGDAQANYAMETGTSGIQADLRAGTVIDTFGDRDTIQNVGRLIGSNFADTIRGSDGREFLFGRDGHDLIEGRGGNDVLIGDRGNDTLDGGTGENLVAYNLETGSGPVHVDLALGRATDTWGTTDTLRNIAYVNGTDGNDTLLGADAQDNRFFGGAGDDVMDGRDGINLYYTGSGNDRITVGSTRESARDTIVVNGHGNKVITGGDSLGTRYGHHLVFELDEAVTVDLAAGIATSANHRTDFSQALYFLEVGGTAFDDHIRGGNPRHDYLEWFVGNQGNDTLDGVRGSANTVVYEDEVTIGSWNPRTGRHEHGTMGVIVHLGNNYGRDTFGYTDLLLNIDDIRATQFADNLTGSAGDNAFWGLRGNDTINGGSGGSNRTHYGEDYLTGGTAGVRVNLAEGFAIDGFGDRDTLVNIQEAYGTTTHDHMTGNAENNRFFGYGGNDTLIGGAGDDVLVGGDGDDFLQGGDGKDELWGGAGNNNINGGAGFDLLRYRDDPGGVSVNLVAGEAVNGFGGRDTLVSIEAVHGSDFNDTLNGNAIANELAGFDGNDILRGFGGNDTLLGGRGNDLLEGGAGDDYLAGGHGADTLNGGDGRDLARYRSSPAGVTVNLIDGRASDGYGFIDHLISVEDVHGSDFNDRLVGDAGANELSGFDGNDTLQGGGGADTLLGGGGNDSLEGGAGDDQIWAGSGNNTVDGGTGRDMLRYLDATAGVVANLATGVANRGDGGRDTIRNIQDLHGSNFNDHLTGDDQANELSGFEGNDTLDGGGGNDTLVSGPGNNLLRGGAGDDLLVGNGGNNTLDGGAGSDMVRYRESRVAVTVDLGAGTANKGAEGTDRLISVENAQGSEFGDLIRGSVDGNRIFGFGGNDTLLGLGGDDTLLGGDGHDSLAGGTGDDELWGGPGNDTIDGGDGNDLVRYRDSIAPVNVNLATGVAQDGFGSTDRLISVENAHGSDFADTLTGDNGANRLFGFAGRDVIHGGGGNDVILGGDGNDTLHGGDGDDELWGEAGDDLIDGGAGSDLVSYRNAGPAGVRVNLVLGRATGEGNDTLIGIENVNGSDGNDLIIGDSAANRLFGFAGNDTLIGGTGDDVLSGGAGNDRYEFRAGDGYDVVNDLGGGTDRVVFHDYVASEATIRRQNPANEVIAIDFGLTGDGVALANTLNASHIGAIEQIQWADGTVWNHAQIIAAIGQVGRLRSPQPGTGPDTINGTSGDDTLDGLGGNDILRGLNGNDRLSGGDGNDTLIGGDGNDTLLGGAGNDLLEGGQGNNLIDGGTGTDTAVWGIALSQVQIGTTAGGFTVTSALGTDTVRNVESFRFEGQTLTLTELTQIAQNRAPVSTLPATLSNPEGRVSVDLTRFFSDPDGDTMSFSVSGLPEFLAQQSGPGLRIEGDVEASLAPFRVTITAADPFNGRTTVTVDWTITNINAAPTGGVEILGVPRDGNLLRSDVATLADADGLGALSYAWLRGGTPIPGATGETYRLTTADVGAQIGLRVSYTDGFGTRESVTASATLPVANVNNPASGQPVIEGRVAEGEELRAITSAIEDADGLGTFDYVWLRNGTHIPGATEASYRLTAADVGTRITVEVQFTDAMGTFEAVLSNPTAAVLLGNRPPTGGVAITGTPATGRTLQADVSTLADPNGLGPLDYQWLRDGGPIPAATGASYTLVGADAGAQISLRVSFVDGGGTRETVTSPLTGPVLAVNSPAVGQIWITGQARQGATLAVDTARLNDPDGLGTFEYQWLRDGQAIAGATAATYVPVQADVNRTLSVAVSFVDGLGTRERVVSNTHGPIQNVNDAPVGRPAIIGTPFVGETLTVDTSGISDPDGITRFFYEWWLNGQRIPGAFSESYTLQPGDLGGNLTARVSYTDGFGTAESLTSPGVVVASSGQTFQGTPGNDRITGTDGADTIHGGDGGDTLIGGSGDDIIFGGATAADVRDVIFGGDGNDSIDGGYGNDEIRGDAGNDTLIGGFGSDTLIGGTGDDLLSGGPLGDMLSGGDGNDTLNGGFGHDRLNGGAGADWFYHLGIADHGSDWIQDYNAAEGDVLQFGNIQATRAQFQVNYTETQGAGQAGVDEAFIIYRPTGQIIWALVDGGAQDSINLRIGADVFDLLG